VTQALVDGYGRVHRDLRISVTDRCNLRCTYCMPAEGMNWLPRSDLLTFEEIERLARLMVARFGFTSIRLTGGEPTVRARLPDLVGRLAALDVDLSLTTNATNLGLIARDLAAAGLRRVNISLDSLRRDRVIELTRRDCLDQVLDGIDAALDAGLDPVKVNAVLIRGVNDDEVIDFATFGRERGVSVRFIEFMPLDASGEWSADKVVSRHEIVAAIEAVYPIDSRHQHDGSEPAETFRYRDGAGDFGVIASVTDAFCGSCDRVRLTAEGQLRSCLFALDETDLRALLRGGGSDDDLAAAVSQCVAGKWAGHMVNNVHFIRPRRSMSQIGG
jgi:cyclic pyranopterin phosphate synthase